jgi:ribosomal-protein-alanine N-acetyltransferase
MLTHKGTQTIETSRLILRKAVREDAEPMFRNWASDPEVTKYLTWPTYEKVETAYQILELWVHEYEKQNQSIVHLFTHFDLIVPSR